MSSSKDWPHQYVRMYPSGETSYVVDLGKINGKRKRRTFPTKAQADKFARRVRRLRDKQGASAFTLPFEVLGQAKRLYDLLDPHGIMFDDVYRHYAEEMIPYLKVPNAGEIAGQLMTRLKERGNRPSSIKSVESLLKEFTSMFGERQLADLTEDELEKFCFKPGLAPKTRRNRRAVASQLFIFAVKKKWVKENTVLLLETPRLPDKEPAFLQVEQVRRLLVEAGRFGLLGYLLLAVFAGIRPDEIQRLEWTDVHLDARQIVIKAAAAKIHQRREVPIHDTLLAWLPLCARPSGPIVDPKSFSERFTAWWRSAGIEEWPHDVLRHTFATYHAAAFKNQEETARQMGHIGGLGILKKHYVAYVTENVAREFWALTPDQVLGK